MSTTPRYQLPFGDSDAAILRLDTIIFGGWSPDLDRMVASTRTFAWHGGYNLDGSVSVDGTIVIPDGTTKYVQRTATGAVTADAALDLLTKLPMAKVTAAGGVLTNFEDLREVSLWALHKLFSGADGDLVYGDATGGPQVLPIGDELQVLAVASGKPQWVDASAGAGDILAVVEERPGTPSPYDDEFDGTGTVDAKWTVDSGTSSDYTMRHSRLLSKTSTTVALKQTPAYLTNPLRIRACFQGWATAGGYAGMAVLLQGVTKGLNFSVDDANGGVARRLAVQRFSSGAAWEADLMTNTFDTNDGQTARSNFELEITLLVDATNVTIYMGPPGSPKVIYAYARSNLGTLSYVRLSLSEGTSVKWFRMDKATKPYAFNLDWA